MKRKHTANSPPNAPEAETAEVNIAKRSPSSSLLYQLMRAVSTGGHPSWGSTTKRNNRSLRVRTQLQRLQEGYGGLRASLSFIPLRRVQNLQSRPAKFSTRPKQVCPTHVGNVETPREMKRRTVAIPQKKIIDDNQMDGFKRLISKLEGI